MDVFCLLNYKYSGLKLIVYFPPLHSPVNIGSIHIVLHEDSTAIDHLQSSFQACVLDYVIHTRPSLRKVILE